MEKIKSIFFLSLILGITFIATNHDFKQASGELFTNMELYTETLSLPSTTIESNEQYMLFDTTNIANMSKVTVTTNIPCDSNGNPKLKVTAGTLENYTDVIFTSLQNLNFTGPYGSCTFSGTVLASDENITINKIWLTPNNGTNKVNIGDGKLLTLTALLSEGDIGPVPYSCGTGHTNNGDGTCIFNYTAGIYKRYYSALLSGGETNCLSGIAVGGSDTNTQGHVRVTDVANTRCQAYTIKTDISSLPVTITINTVKIRYDVDAVTNPNSCDFFEISNDPASSSDATIWSDIRNGDNYANGSTSCNSAGDDKIITFASTANSDIQTLRNSSIDWWAFAISADQWESAVGQDEVTIDPTTVEIEITYTP